MIKNERGITLISLVITIVVITILTVSLTTSVTSTIELQEYNKVKEDAISLSEAVKNYYLKNKKLPAYTGKSYNLSDYGIPSNDINPNDEGAYYAIDLTVLPADLELNCGEGNIYKDYSSDDIYVLNESSLTVYYLKGVTLNGAKHYTIVDDYNGGGFATDYYKKIETTEQENSNYMVDGTIGKDTLSDAVASATNGSTIKVMKDTTETQTVKIDKDITLNTNGKTITCDSSSDSDSGGICGGILVSATCIFNGNGKIYSNNGGYALGGLVRTTETGNLTIDGVDMDDEDEYVLAPCWGTVIINSGNIKNVRAWAGNLIINGGNIESIGVRCGTISINGGKIGTIDCHGLSDDGMTINIGDANKAICENPVIQKLIDETNLALTEEHTINYNNGIIGEISSRGQGYDDGYFIEYVRSGYTLKQQSDGYYHLVKTGS